MHKEENEDKTRISESMAFDLWCLGPKRLSLTQKPNDIFFDTSIVKIDVNGQEKQPLSLFYVD